VLSGTPIDIETVPARWVEQRMPWPETAAGQHFLVSGTLMGADDETEVQILFLDASARPLWWAGTRPWLESGQDGSFRIPRGAAREVPPAAGGVEHPSWQAVESVAIRARSPSVGTVRVTELRLLTWPPGRDEPHRASAVPTDRQFVHRHEHKSDPDYAPSFFDDGWISARQETLLEALADVPGWLAPSDHFKLYEAGYFARGPIIEVGRLDAKSTIILALGNRDAGRDDAIYSIEKHRNSLASAEESLGVFGLLDRITLIQGDSAIQLKRIAAPFDVVFLDGDHSYEGVRRDLDAMRGNLGRGAPLMIHDYYNAKNDTGEYGVRRAVDEAAASMSISFRGRFGGIALYEQM
jgi:hypothetical protein